MTTIYENRKINDRYAAQLKAAFLEVCADPTQLRLWRPVFVVAAKRMDRFTWEVIARGVGYTQYQTARNCYSGHVDKVEESEVEYVLDIIRKHVDAAQ